MYKLIKHKTMESVFQNPGLSHISQKILKNLDFKSLTSLRLVCKSANYQVEDLASGITLNELQGLLEKFSIARRLQLAQKNDWKRFLNYICNNWSESINDWPESNKFMNLYLKEILSRDAQYKSSLQNSPILEFILYGNKEMVEYILYHEDSAYYFIGENRNSKADLQEEANSLGHTDICETLKSFTIFKKFSLSTLEQKQLNENVQSDSGKEIFGPSSLDEEQFNVFEDGKSDSDETTSETTSLEEERFYGHIEATAGPYPSPSSSP